MAAQSGDDVILKIGNSATPLEGFSEIGGVRLTSFTLNNNVIKQNSLVSGKWQKLNGNCGISSVAISVSGYFNDSASEETLRLAAFSASVKNFELHFGNGDKLSGAFLIEQYSRSGDFGSQEDFSIRLQSAGEVVFAA